MARIDDYNEALEIGRQRLSGKDPDLFATFCGASIQRDEHKNPVLRLNFLNRGVKVTWPDMKFLYEDVREELPIQQRILLLHYLNGVWSSNGARITGEWIAFQDVPDGKFYQDAFMRRAKVPLVKGFGDNPQLLVEVASMAYGARPFDHGDFSVVVQTLPLVPLALVLWEGDEEFPPDGNILFDRNISKIFSAEDIAWLAGMVVYPLVGIAKAPSERG